MAVKHYKTFLRRELFDSFLKNVGAEHLDRYLRRHCKAYASCPEGVFVPWWSNSFPEVSGIQHKVGERFVVVEFDVLNDCPDGAI